MTDTTTKNFHNLVIPGRHPDGTVWIEIQYSHDRLSITGVIGPLRSGNARGGCGQIRDELAHTKADTPWNAEMIAELGEIWDAWHLNDMRSGCEHQRAEGWDKRPIDPSKPLDAYGTHFEGQKQSSWNMLTWVRPDEHPDGLLTVPCPVCGYKFGTAWLTEEVPDEVLDWLRDLPEAERQCPWSSMEGEHYP